jgi:hypothetical protein
MMEYPRVTAHYAPSAGYFPLPGWAGLAPLCADTMIVGWAALGRTPAANAHRDIQTGAAAGRQVRTT